MDPSPKIIPLSAIFAVFFRIGAFSFGGGLVSWIHRETVDKRGWLTNAQFLSGMALGQVLPGANVANVAIYVGQTLRGPIGAAVALVAVLTGPFIGVIALASVYSQAIRIPGFHAAMDGIAAAAVGMILRMGYVGAVHGCRKLPQAAVAVAVVVSIGILNWPMLPVIIVMAPVSVWLAWIGARQHA